MRNKYILLEMNQRNEIRADVNMTIKSMELTEIENMNVKIDTGCPYTSIPILKLGISKVKYGYPFPNGYTYWKKQDSWKNSFPSMSL